MIDSEGLLSQTEQFVMGEFMRGKSETHIYHNQHHTREVVGAARMIGKALHLSDAELEIVTLAAWFHDIGYIQGWKDHEERSAATAEQFLSQYGYPKEKIQKITGCILATKVPQQPKSLIEEVLCDADLLNLGEQDSIERGQLLRKEQEKMNGIMISDEEWLKHSIDFFINHHYHTEFVRKRCGEWKERNIAQLRQTLQEVLLKTAETK